MDESAERVCFVLGVSLHYADTFSQPSHFFGAPKGRIVQLWTDRWLPTSGMLHVFAICLAGFEEILTLQWGVSRTGRPFHLVDLSIRGKSAPRYHVPPRFSVPPRYQRFN